MSHSLLTREYRCWNDCQMSGCPGHTMEMTFQSVSDAFCVKDGKGQEFYFQTPELEAMFSMFGELSTYRTELIAALKALEKAREA